LSLRLNPGRVRDSRFRGCSLGLSFKVKGLGFKVQGLALKIHSLGQKV
jgi:hypothetical protein